MPFPKRTEGLLIVLFFPPTHFCYPRFSGDRCLEAEETGSCTQSAARLSLESRWLNQSFRSLVGLWRHINVLLESDWQAHSGPVCGRYWAGLNLKDLITLWFKILAIFHLEGNIAANSKFSSWLILLLQPSHHFRGFLWILKCLQEVSVLQGTFAYMNKSYISVQAVYLSAAQNVWLL